VPPPQPRPSCVDPGPSVMEIRRRLQRRRSGQSTGRGSISDIGVPDGFGDYFFFFAVPFIAWSCFFCCCCDLIEGVTAQFLTSGVKKNKKIKNKKIK
jgi:hypothetical protein